MARPREPRAPKTTAPTLKEACVRVAEFIRLYAPGDWGDGYDVLVDGEYNYGEGALLLRSDVVALLAAVGWVEPLEAPATHVEEPLL